MQEASTSTPMAPDVPASSGEWMRVDDEVVSSHHTDRTGVRSIQPRPPRTVVPGRTYDLHLSFDCTTVQEVMHIPEKVFNRYSILVPKAVIPEVKPEEVDKPAQKADGEYPSRLEEVLTV